MRTCIGCRKVAPMCELARMARASDGSVQLGRTAPGRGAWLCAGAHTRLPAAACLDQAIRRKALTRALRAPVEPAAMKALRERVEERARIESGGAE